MSRLKITIEIPDGQEEFTVTSLVECREQGKPVVFASVAGEYIAAHVIDVERGDA